VEGEVEWNARKHGGPKRRVWRKLHLGIDEKTLEVRAVEVTGSHIGDAPVLPDLLNGEIFYSLREAQIIIEEWRKHYNTKIPHSALGYRPPAPEAILHLDQRPIMH